MKTTTNANDGSNINNDDEVGITLLHPPTSGTDMIAMLRSKTTLLDLSGYAAALLGILLGNDNDVSKGGEGGGAVLTMGGALLYHPHRPSPFSSTTGGDDPGNRTLF
jgi:hypothetical protein